MAVAVKKYKLFKVCKELNVGMDTIRPFLEDKGIKLSGPNTPLTEEIYLEILENFSREKEIADQLHQRKVHSDVDETSGDENESGVGEVVEKSIYVQAIERSIEERMEEMIREEVDAKKKKPVSKKKKVTAEEEKGSEDIVEQAKEFIDASVEEVATTEPIEIKAEEKEIVAGEPDVEEKPPVKEEKKEPDVIRKIDLDSIEGGQKRKRKTKAKEKKVLSKEEAAKEKEDKRRIALEMIRKDEKRKKRMVRPGAEADQIGAAKRQRVRKPKKKAVDQKEIQDTVKKTLASIDDRLKKPKKRRKIKEDTGEVVEENLIYASEFISASDLANLMDVPAGEIITKCLDLGLVVSINQRLDIDTIELLAGE
jgi:translation initiation factor IF-2